MKLITFLIDKWIYGRCRHICLLCEYRKEHFKECYNCKVKGSISKWLRRIYYGNR